jgi:tetratricopeptide (TPR) repeat protein
MMGRSASTEAAELRHITHYLDELTALDDAYELGRLEESTVRGIRERFEQDWRQIAKAQRLANADYPGYCAAFAIHGATLLKHVANGRDRLEWFRSAWAACERLPAPGADSNGGARPDSPISKREVLYGLGCALADTGDADEALRVLRAALAQADGLGSGHRRGRKSGTVSRRHVPTRKWKWHNWPAESFIVEPHSGPDNSSILNDIGNAYYRRGANWRSLIWFWRALRAARTSGNKLMEGIALGNLAMLLAAIGDPDAALPLHLKSIRLAQQRGHWDLEANQVGNVGILFSDFGVYAAAAHYYERGRQIHAAHGSHAAVAQSLGELAINQAREGDIDSAEEGFFVAMKSLESSGYEGRIGVFASHARKIDPGRHPKGTYSFATAEQIASTASRISRLRVFARRCIMCGGIAAVAGLSYRFGLPHQVLGGRIIVAVLLGSICGQFLIIRLIEAFLERRLLRISIGRGKPSDERFFRALSALFPERRSILHCYATWLDWSGRNEEAIELLTRRARYVASDFGLSCQMAWALADAGTDLAEASAWVEHAKRLNPDNPCLYDTEAWIDFRRKHYDAAWEKIREAIPLADWSPDIAYHAAVILASKGNVTKASAFVTKAVRSLRPFSRRPEAVILHRNLMSNRRPRT